MQTEIEAKFLNVAPDDMRQKLTSLGAVCTVKWRLMRRAVIHTPDMTAKNAFVRVRDEGNRVTVTYKQFDADSVDGAKEYEVVVSDFDSAVALFGAAGLPHDTFQESYRENWQMDKAEIMLDEWPWLNPYIEIEAKTEQKVKEIAAELGFSWAEAVFGGVANVYQKQYPHIGEKGRNEINQNWPLIRFTDSKPALLKSPL